MWNMEVTPQVHVWEIESCVHGFCVISSIDDAIILPLMLTFLSNDWRRFALAVAQRQEEEWGGSSSVIFPIWKKSEMTRKRRHIPAKECICWDLMGNKLCAFIYCTVLLNTISHRKQDKWISTDIFFYRRRIWKRTLEHLILHCTVITSNSILGIINIINILINNSSNK